MENDKRNGAKAKSASKRDLFIAEKAKKYTKMRPTPKPMTKRIGGEIYTLHPSFAFGEFIKVEGIKDYQIDRVIEAKELHKKAALYLHMYQEEPLFIFVKSNCAMRRVNINPIDIMIGMLELEKPSRNGYEVYTGRITGEHRAAFLRANPEVDGYLLGGDVTLQGLVKKLEEKRESEQTNKFALANKNAMC
jgi:hypothetical protein